ncbi:MAG TPA: hypothetical protein VL122_09960 [Nitrospirota bacterium]|nr:hypothetical protein [Nitrospirota bacterium]
MPTTNDLLTRKVLGHEYELPIIAWLRLYPVTSGFDHLLPAEAGVAG